MSSDLSHLVQQSNQQSKSQGGDLSAAIRNGAASVHDLGTTLRDRREAMGISLAEVEAATRIRVKYLAALESDEWHLLPGEVVGRGFLRNYADFLGLEPNEIIERRRAIADPGLSAALSSTSAGAPLPQMRTVDYRPKEVDLKDEGDGIQRVEIHWRPIFMVLGLVLLLIVGAWTVVQFSASLGTALGGVGERITELWERPEPTPTSATIAGVVNVQNLGADGTPMAVPTPIVPSTSGSGAPGAAATLPGSILLPSPTPNPQGGNPQTGNPQAADAQAANPPAENAQPAVGLPVPTDTPQQLLQPTNTPEAAQPTATFTLEPPTPTFTPEPPTATPEPLVPTDTPVPEPPPVVAAACADPRAVIASPGVNQVVSGVVAVSGTATHENLQYYKLEYGAGGNFVYFDGSSSHINGGVLGNLDTRALPNGEYVIRLTVVDQTSNYPPPCDVSVVIQN